MGLQNVKTGDIPKAADWNELVRLSKRTVTGPRVTDTGQGWHIRDKPEQGVILGKIVCAGPSGETNPTNEMYWVEKQTIPEEDPTDATKPITFEADNREIVLATNRLETPFHTHGARIGTPVRLSWVTDAGGNRRWQFALMVPLMLMALGGIFSACGVTRADSVAVLNVDTWSSLTPVPAYNASDQILSGATDIAFYEATWWICGEFTLADGASTGAYSFARWDLDDEEWIGFRPDSKTGGAGTALYVWDDKLFCAQSGGSGPGTSAAEVRYITYAPDTKTITPTDFGWVAAVNPTDGGAECYDMLEWDDGLGGGEQLYFVGMFLANAAYGNLVRWNGSAFSGIGGCSDLVNDQLRAIDIHDFEDGDGEKLCVGGTFGTIGGTAGCNNVAAYDTGTTTWEVLGDGIDMESNAHLEALCSFNGRLWAARGFRLVIYPPSNDTLVAWPNGPGARWVDASLLVHDLTGEFQSRYWTAGAYNTTGRAPVFSLRRYNGKMVIGGAFTERLTKWGEQRTGAVTRYVSADDEFVRCLPMLRGDVYCLMNYGGVLAVGGDFHVPATSTRGPIDSFGLWTDPGDDTDGTWESLGVVEGTVYAACMYLGDLYIAGDIVSVGGLAVKGIARWDGSTWNYVANFSDYGTIRALTVHNGVLVIGGDFSAVDGQAQYKIACTWTGYVLGTLFDDIDASDGYPLVNALHVDSGYLYMAGWFDTITDPGALTARCVARMSAGGTWSELFDNDGGPTEGITNDRVAYSLTSIGGWLYMGCEADTFVGGATGYEHVPLWKWDTATPDWRKVHGGGGMGGPSFDGPSYVVTHDGTDPVLAENSHGTSYDAGLAGALDRVYNATGGTYYGGNASTFDGPIRAMYYGSVGAGARLYVAGQFRAVGDIVSRSPKPCQCITALGEDDKIHDIRGGIGFGSYASSQWGVLMHPAVLRTRVIPSEDVDARCDTLAIAGNFTRLNDAYSPYICGINIAGRIVPMQGGLAGTYRGNQTGALDGVTSSKAIPYSEWPDYWKTDIATIDEPQEKMLWLIGGSFTEAFNTRIMDEDVAVIEDSMIQLSGVVGFCGGYFRRLQQQNVSAIEYNSSMEVFDGKMVAVGGIASPREYTGDADSGSWASLISDTTAGAIYGPVSTTWDVIRHASLLWGVGVNYVYPNTAPGDDTYAVWSWNGSTYTFYEPPGFPAGDGLCEGFATALADLAGDGVVFLYVGGTPDGTGNPVVQRDAAGTWSAVGAATLRGTCYGLSGVEYLDGRQLIAVGVMEVWVDPDWIPCQVAAWDGATWTAIGWFDYLGSATDRAVSGDHFGRQVPDAGSVRALVGGNIAEVAGASADIGTTDGVPVFGLSEWHRSPWSWQTPADGGVNGVVRSIGNAGPILFPRP